MALKLPKTFGQWKQRRHSSRRMYTCVSYSCSLSLRNCWWPVVETAYWKRWILELIRYYSAYVVFSLPLFFSLWNALGCVTLVIYLYRCNHLERSDDKRKELFPLFSWVLQSNLTASIPERRHSFLILKHARNFIRGWKKHFSCILLYL